jgi:hypothetical protein
LYIQSSKFSNALTVGIIICIIFLSPLASSIAKEKINFPPLKPDPPIGPKEIKIGETYKFTVVTTDPNKDRISYLIDWGDGSTSGWTNWYPSGENVSAYHSWRYGNPYVRVKAKDEYGAESEWSEPYRPSNIINIEKYEHVSYENCMPSCNHLGYVMDSGTNCSFYEFILSNPDNLTCVCDGVGFSGVSGITCSNDDIIYSCEYGNGVLYGIDIETCEIWSIGGGGTGIYGLAFDHFSEQLYGSSDDDYLYKIDPETGEQEQIGPFGSGVGYMVGMAFDAEGTLYGWDLVCDKLWTINRSK